MMSVKSTIMGLFPQIVPFLKEELMQWLRQTVFEYLRELFRADIIRTHDPVANQFDSSLTIRPNIHFSLYIQFLHTRRIKNTFAQALDVELFHVSREGLMAESDEEWEEAKKVNARLIELGETPVVAIQEYPVITDIKEMLEYDCKDAAEALPMMSKSLAMFDDDYVTKNMIQQFIVDEQEHFNWVRQHLNLIEEIGYENYLIEQLGE